VFSDSTTVDRFRTLATTADPEAVATVSSAGMGTDELGGPAGSIRVLIADDESEVRAALAELISSEDDLELVGAAGDADEAIELAIAKSPDVALVDVKMPAGGGSRAAREICRTSPQTRVLALSAYEDKTTVMEMLRAGAVGYLVKGTAPEEIVASIGRAVRGQTAMSTEVMGSVVHELSAHLRDQAVAREERQSQVERIQRVIAGDGMHMAFQPIVDLHDRRIVGVEALARFAGPPNRSPELWFGEAAAIGLGEELELAAIRLALSSLSRVPPDAHLALNTSHRTAMSPRLLDVLAESDPNRIVVEITEHEQADDYEGLRRSLERLRRRGVRVAIDDAGAGFSLRHALTLDPHILKLDISLTRDVDSDRARRALASALVRFAEEMDVTVVAEGIESEAELQELVGLGVGYGQGFLLGVPGPLN
jgi:EAL domain-containing protein (putative c-di-GMP-specific phosphodiesterase class I)/AmiR/NasT family two-component response regulator